MNVDQDRYMVKPEQEAITPGEIWAIARRRVWSLVLPAALIMLAAGIVAVVLPPVYKSSTTILIEEQDIPSDFVSSTVSSYVEERLQTINQRIMSTARLSGIITDFNLYPEEREKITLDEIVEQMREDIVMLPISAEVEGSRSGRAEKGTIAFTLSYQGRIPETVQQVAGTLASLFLEENLKTRERQAAETTGFLSAELAKIEARLAEIDTQVAVFKEQNFNQLPDMVPVNVQSLNHIENQIELNQERLNRLKERRVYVQTQLASLSAEIPRLTTGNTGPVDDEVLLEQLKQELEYLLTRYSEEYPDVTRVKRRIAELEIKLAEAPPNKTTSSRLSTPNPAYVTLESELAGIEVEVESLGRIISEAQKKADEYRERIEASPRIEGTYQSLMIQRNSLQAKYDDLMEKLMESKVAEGLEKAQMGERFTIIDPARLPTKPFKPNRLAILLIGLVLGVGAGIGLAALREYADDAVCSPEKLEQLTAIPVFSTIPDILTTNDLRRRKYKRYAVAGACLTLVAVSMTAFHFFLMNLDVLWAKIMERFAM